MSYESKGCVNAKVIKSLKRYMVPAVQRWIAIICSVACVVGGVVLIACRNYSYGLGLFIAEGLIITDYLMMQRKNYQVCIKRIQENCGEDGMHCKTVFDNNGCTYTNMKSGGTFHYDYSVFMSVIELREVFCFVTGTVQFIIMFKNDFDEERNIEFRKFIIDKCSNVRRFVWYHSN